MKKADIEAFVNKLSPFSPIRIKFLSENEIGELYANADYILDRSTGRVVNRTIQINRRLFSQESLTEQQAILMHEIGHFENPRIRRSDEREAAAHLWAFKKARQKGWKKIERVLIEFMVSYDRNYTWNQDGGAWRRYIKAASIFRKELRRINGHKLS